MTPKHATVLVQHDAGLAPLLSALADEPWVALDTEFHAERRYHPELFLVQFAFADGRSFVVDPKLVVLDALGPALTDTMCVVHAGQQDLGILWRECGASPHRVFDVQIAAGMLGHGYPTRLGTLVENVLSMTAPPAATLSDWSTRPLSRKQLEYAISDARILVPLRDALMEALRSRGRLEWALNASREMAEKAQQRRTIENRWAAWEVAGQMTTDTVQVMTNLSAWRDQRGRDKNQPPTYMLSDGLALDIARRKPRSLSELSSNRRIPQGLIRKFGREIVAVVNDALVHPPPTPFIPSPGQRTTLKALEMWATAEGLRLEISAGLLLPSEVSMRILEEGLGALEGWRTEAIGDSLAAFMAGQTSICMTTEGPVIR